MPFRFLVLAAVFGVAALPLAGCYVGPRGVVHPAVYVRPAPPPVVVVPRPYPY